ncbi:MAG: universal stress protein [Methanospirillum sp.]|uniref:universal stress protein n=1 Tax=Methanospirillum sp. TaxID=45200 RepID=UPI00236FE77D|nr:universal stress protein [Methanospirillum sp.]MDD1730144.1 universal stress protein [Methanospirillum sp.]
MAIELFEKILIATDGSDMNITAIEEGLKIGRECGSKVFAVYVMDTRRFDKAPTDVMMKDPREVIQTQAASALTFVQSKAEGVNLETVILEGKPDAEIVKYATEKEIDLIVIGTHAKRGIERLLLGSVAEQVIRSASCKILVVK